MYVLPIKVEQIITQRYDPHNENKMSLCYRLVQRYADIIAHLWYESF